MDTSGAALGRGAQARLLAASLCIAVLLAVQLLAISHVDLAGDEGLYWLYAQHLAWGYLTNPPMVGWMIAASTALFGDGLLAIRLPFWLCGVGCLVGTFLWGRQLGGRDAGMLSVLLLLLAPMAWLMGVMANPDTPALLFWIWACYFLQRALDGGSTRWWIVGGSCVGAGLLAKYTVALLPLSLLAALLLHSLRPRCSRQLCLAAGATVLVAAPHLLWLAASGFEALGLRASVHGAEPVRLVGHPAIHFLLGQLVVWSPPLLAAVLWAATAAARSSDERPHLEAMSCVVPLLAFACYSLARPVHPYWTAIALPGGVVCLGTRLAAGRGRRWLLPTMVICSAAIFVAALWPLFAADSVARHGGQLGSYLAERTSRLAGGGEQLASAVARQLETMESDTGRTALITGCDGYASISNVAWRLGRPRDLTLLWWRELDLQFRDWYKPDWVGWDGVFFAPERLWWFPLAACFDGCRLVEEIAPDASFGQRRFRVFSCTGFRGPANRLFEPMRPDSSAKVAEELYQGILGRTPNPQGRASAAAALERGDLPQLVHGLVNSTEARRRFGTEDPQLAIERVFTAIRHRPPSHDELRELVEVHRWASLSGVVARLMAGELGRPGAASSQLDEAS